VTTRLLCSGFHSSAARDHVRTYICRARPALRLPKVRTK
jgi:hypothetical protein